MRKIDIHVHLYPDAISKVHTKRIWQERLGLTFDFDPSVAGYMDQMDRAGITKAFVNSSVQNPELNRKANDFIAGLVQKHPDRFIGVAFVHPLYYDPARELQRCISEHGFRAAKLHPSEVHILANDVRFYPIYEKATQLDIPIIAHCGRNTEEPYRQVLEEQPRYSETKLWRTVLNDFPSMRLILAHLAGADTYWDDALELLRDFPHVCVDTALFPRLMSTDKLVSFIKLVGSDRVMFGSDFAGADVLEDAAKLERLPISDEDKERILYSNASRFFRVG